MSTARAGPVRLRDDRAAVLWLGTITLVGLAVRWYLVLVARPTCGGRFGTDPGSGCFRIYGDALYSFIQGSLIADGHWFKDSAQYFTTGRLFDSAGDPPLYALLLGLLSRVGLESGTAARLVSALVGAGAIALIGMVARSLAGNRAGFIAAGAAALYPMLWINDGMLMSESLYALLIAVVMLVSLWFWREPSWRSALWLGVAFGLASLTRAEAVVMLPLVVVPLAVGARSFPWPKRIGLMAVAGGTCVALLLPWWAFNLGRFEKPVLMSNSPGFVLISASCDATYYGESMGYWANCPQPALPDPSEADESERESILREVALDYQNEHLGRLPLVMVARVGRMWELFRPGQTLRFNWQVEGRGRIPSTLGLAAFYVLVPLAIGGAVVLRRRRLPLSPFVGPILAVTATAALTFGITRYRIPGDVVLVVLAAVAVDAILLRRTTSP